MRKFRTKKKILKIAGICVLIGITAAFFLYGDFIDAVSWAVFTSLMLTRLIQHLTYKITVDESGNIVEHLWLSQNRSLRIDQVRQITKVLHSITRPSNWIFFRWFARWHWGLKGDFSDWRFPYFNIDREFFNYILSKNPSIKVHPEFSKYQDAYHRFFSVGSAFTRAEHKEIGPQDKRGIF